MSITKAAHRLVRRFFRLRLEGKLPNEVRLMRWATVMHEPQVRAFYWMCAWSLMWSMQ